MDQKEQDDVLALLQGKEKGDEEEEVLPVPTTVPMSKGTREKAHTICQIVKKVAGDSHEWFSFLLASKADPLFIARDLLIVKGTKAERGHVVVEGEHVAKASAEVQELNALLGTDFYIIGWLHSHGGGPVGHSFFDDGNFVQVLNSVRLNTEQAVPTRLDLIESRITKHVEDGKIILTGQDVEDAVIRYVLPKEEAFQALLIKYGIEKGKRIAVEREAFLADVLELVQLETAEPKIVGFGYSVVVNDRGEEPYALVGVVEEKVITGKGTVKKYAYKTNVEPREVEKDVTADPQTLEAMVRERIQFPPPTKSTIVVLSSRKRRRRGHGRWFGRWLGDSESYKNGVMSPEDIEAHTHSNSSAPSGGTTTTQTRQKRSQDILFLNEIACIFAYHAAAYLTAFESPAVRYSEYLDRVFEMLDQTHSKGLMETIAHVGELYSDEAGVFVPRFEPYKLKRIQDNITDRLAGDPKHPEIRFMLAFIHGDKNAALEQYIPILYKLGRDKEVEPLARIPPPEGKGK
ncbi:hypothetical protein HYS48_02240 [Candidatus Woesearchaeota archaeon]|nr:hypothetical protein [Candidatus Woesearchaeota archaeon]